MLQLISRRREPGADLSACFALAADTPRAYGAHVTIARSPAVTRARSFLRSGFLLDQHQRDLERLVRSDLLLGVHLDAVLAVDHECRRRAYAVRLDEVVAIRDLAVGDERVRGGEERLRIDAVFGVELVRERIDREQLLMLDVQRLEQRSVRLVEHAERTRRVERT